MKSKLSTQALMICIVAVVFIFLYYFIFLNTSECFEGAYELGLIFSRLSLSYISAFIFYIMINYLPAQKRENEFAKIFKYHADIIENAYSSLYNEFAKDSTDKINVISPDLNLMNKKLSSSNWMDEANLQNQDFKKLNLLEFAESKCVIISKSITAIEGIKGEIPSRIYISLQELKNKNLDKALGLIRANINRPGVSPTSIKTFIENNLKVLSVFIIEKNKYLIKIKS